MSLTGEREHSAAEIVTALRAPHRLLSTTIIGRQSRPAGKLPHRVCLVRRSLTHHGETHDRASHGRDRRLRVSTMAIVVRGTTLLGKFAGRRASQGGTTRTGARSDRSMDQCEYRPSTVSENDSERRLRGPARPRRPGRPACRFPGEGRTVGTGYLRPALAALYRRYHRSLLRRHERRNETGGRGYADILRRRVDVVHLAMVIAGVGVFEMSVTVI